MRTTRWRRHLASGTTTVAVVALMGVSSPASAATAPTASERASPYQPVLEATDNAAEYDRLTVRAGSAGAGLEVRLYTRVQGERELLTTRRLNDRGRKIFIRADLNGAARTTYFAVIVAPGDHRVRTNSRAVR